MGCSKRISNSHTTFTTCINGSHDIVRSENEREWEVARTSVTNNCNNTKSTVCTKFSLSNKMQTNTYHMLVLRPMRNTSNNRPFKVVTTINLLEHEITMRKILSVTDYRNNNITSRCKKPFLGHVWSSRAESASQENTVTWSNCVRLNVCPLPIHVITYSVLLHSRAATTVPSESSQVDFQLRLRSSHAHCSRNWKSIFNGTCSSLALGIFLHSWLTGTT